MSAPPADDWARDERVVVDGWDGRKPSQRPTIDRDYEQLRVNMHKLFKDLAIERTPA